MNRKVALLIVTLVASVGLNVYLGLVRGPKASEPAAHAVPRAADTPIVSPLTKQVVIGALDDRRLGCDRVLAECREARAQADEKLAAMRPPHQRFESADPESGNPDDEARLSQHLDRLVEDGLDTSVECRGQTCRVEVIAPADGDSDWMRAVQSDPDFRGLAERMSFQAARPTTDPVSGKGLLAHQMFLDLKDPDAVAGGPLLAELVAELEESGEIERCAGEHAGDTGTLSYRLQTEGRRVRLDFGGDLYATDAGRCIAEAQSRIAAAAELPDKFTGAVLYHHVTLPLDRGEP